MRMIEVYHLKENCPKRRDIQFDANAMIPTIEIAFSLGFYEKVAKVRSDNNKKRGIEGHLDNAYEATNHMRDAWQKNENVEAFADKARSTSVGDVMVTNTAAGPNYWAVCGFGFKRIQPLDIIS